GWGRGEGGGGVGGDIAGVAQGARPPLFYAFAAANAQALDGVLSLHDGARIAVGIVLALALWFLALAGRELYGRAFRWLPVLIFIGCVGLWDRGHQLSSDVAVLAACALALYALALALRRPAVAGPLPGLAPRLAFLCRGPLGAIFIAVTALLVPLFPAWRRRGFALTLVIAFLVSLPLVLLWPAALYFREPPLLAEWWNSHNPARFLGLAPGSPPPEP